MRLKNHGQSTLEYILLASIIFLGIVVGGPFLQKAVQGYFKLTEESMQDSMSEKIKQEPTSDSGPACSCDAADDVSTWPSTVCGLDCGQLERYHYRSCTPLQCKREHACLPDPTCCTLIEPVSCGRTHSSLCAGRSAVSSHFSADYIGTCASTTDCAYGERLYKIACGNPATSSDTFYACKSNNETKLNCLPFCFGPLSIGDSPCNADERDTLGDIGDRTALIKELVTRQSEVASPIRPYTPEPGVPDIATKNAFRLHYTYLIPTSCADDRYCERQCPTGFAPNADNSGCDPLACWFGWWAKAVEADHDIEADTTCGDPDKRPKICSDNIAICGYVLICSSTGGITSQTYGISDVQQHPFGAACPDGYKKISDQHNLWTICYTLSPAAAPASPAQPAFNCDAGDNTTKNTLYYAVVACPNP